MISEAGVTSFGLRPSERFLLCSKNHHVTVVHCKRNGQSVRNNDVRVRNEKPKFDPSIVLKSCNLW